MVSRAKHKAGRLALAVASMLRRAVRTDKPDKGHYLCCAAVPRAPLSDKKSTNSAIYGAISRLEPRGNLGQKGHFSYLQPRLSGAEALDVAVANSR